MEKLELEPDLESNPCGICLMPIEQIIQFKCSHQFCCQCIEQWITTQLSSIKQVDQRIQKFYLCPICREGMPQNYGFVCSGCRYIYSSEFIEQNGSNCRYCVNQLTSQINLEPNIIDSGENVVMLVNHNRDENQPDQSTGRSTHLFLNCGILFGFLFFLLIIYITWFHY